MTCFFLFQVKILVPNSTAGMIIGKAGNYIKQIKEESGAYVQISQKSKETNLPERCITVAGIGPPLLLILAGYLFTLYTPSLGTKSIN